MEMLQILSAYLVLAVPFFKGVIGNDKHTVVSVLDDTEQLTGTSVNDFVKDTERIGIVLKYPSYSVFENTGTREFSTISKIFKDNTKCKFGMYQVPVHLDSTQDDLHSTVYYMKDGKMVVYDGPLTVGGIMGWISFEQLCDITIEDLGRIKLYHNSLEGGYMQLYIFLTEATNDLERVKAIHNDLVMTGFKTPIIHTTNEEAMSFLLQKYGLELHVITLPAIMVCRNIPHMQRVYFYWKDWPNDEEIKKFFQVQLVPTVHGTDSFMFNELLKEEKIFVYIYTKDDDIKKYIDHLWLNKVAKNNLDIFRFIYCKGNPQIEMKLNKLLVIDYEYVECAVRAFEMHPSRGEFVKYRPVSLYDGEITQAGFIKFLHDLRDGRLHHFVKSENAIPEKIDIGPVKTIVGEDFHHRVIESDCDYLILFYSPWCGHCHHAKRIFRDLGRRVKGVDHLLIGKFDAFNNEVEHIIISQYPTILMFPHAHKHEPVMYTGEVTIEGLARFVERECKKAWVSAKTILSREVKHEQLFEFHSEL
ncbi:bifunctional Thioredoxin-like superfamily/Thioredoxin domain [Babesia duncani]|uniref:Bifunctional Thioredoxin-like superfamily/Thioredoxin domain n=1 Tax=Babesia duncani TaxID=323732 RepID=A0AAD9UPS9_9APIC|nr:bifunctional Thioredoxin-like superfamily/Thioredoxin domain [Babesia duncani]